MNKKTIIILLVILILFIGILTTYAWFTWSSTNNTSLTMTIGELADITFRNGNDISTNALSPVFNYTDGEKTTFAINNKSTDNTLIEYSVKLNIKNIADELKSTSLKYTLIKENSIVSEGDFISANQNSTIKIYTDTISSGEDKFTFYLYIDGNEENDLNMMDKTLEAEILVTAMEGSQNASLHVSYLYNNIEKIEIENNSVTYNYGTSKSLMTDNFGNIRYYGKTPNNYIYFNCDDYTNQSSTTCEIWRIIGVFDGKIKIIRSETIGEYSFDNKGKSSGADTSDGKNNWADSRLMQMLNPNYESETGGSLYWNRQNGTCYSGGNPDSTKTCDMSSIGLKNSTTRNLIQEVTLSLLGWDSNSVYADQIYKYERTEGALYNESRDKTWTGYVALAYPSDYAYSTDLSLCDKTIKNYNNDSCINNNWMYFTNARQWLLTPSSGSSDRGFLIRPSGSIDDNNNVDSEYDVRPVVYLDINQELNYGTGEENNPYQLAV